MTMRSDAITRRQFLLFGLSWFPFFWRHYATIAGIRFRRIRKGDSPRRFLHVHGNERTARAVLERHVGDKGGTAYLTPSKERWVKIEGGKLDPNRMFSRAGAEKNLRSLNPHWDPARLQRALDRLDRDRDSFVTKLTPPPGGLLVALHNNGPGYSVSDEVPISDRIALNDRLHPHEFLLATEAADFEILARSPYNAVLQNAAPPDDDGSLSRLMARRGVRYVNIEVSHGEFARQREILEWLDGNLP